MYAESEILYSLEKIWNRGQAIKLGFLKPDVNLDIIKTFKNVSYPHNTSFLLKFLKTDVYLEMLSSQMFWLDQFLA